MCVNSHTLPEESRGPGEKRFWNYKYHQRLSKSEVLNNLLIPKNLLNLCQKDMINLRKRLKKKLRCCVISVQYFLERLPPFYNCHLQISAPHRKENFKWMPPWNEHSLLILADGVKTYKDTIKILLWQDKIISFPAINVCFSLPIKWAMFNK